MYTETNPVEFAHKCDEAESFSGLADIAIEELKKFSSGAHMVCGPISTGGLEDREQNLRIFHAVIAYLQSDGVTIFSQAPYEKRMCALRDEWKRTCAASDNQYCMPILEEFYLPILESGLITFGWFLPNWATSLGARWEHAKMRERGIQIQNISNDWVAKALTRHDTPLRSVG